MTRNILRKSTCVDMLLNAHGQIHIKPIADIIFSVLNVRKNLAFIERIPKYSVNDDHHLGLICKFTKLMRPSSNSGFR